MYAERLVGLMWGMSKVEQQTPKGVATHREVEVKMRVASDFDVATYLQDLPGITLIGPDTNHLVATYYDTEELTLIRWGITLRRREGGTDAGWHLKLPVTNSKDAAREELHLPLSSGDSGEVPKEFIAIVAPLLRNKEIHYIADIKTIRTTHTLVDKNGVSLVEVADDHVTVDQHGKEINAFHEIEVEVLHDSQRATNILRKLQKRILDSGATPTKVSKLASALGPLATESPDVPHLAPLAQDCTAIDFIQHVISDHTRHLLLADIGVRWGVPDSIHQMRVAARRLRSTLRAFEGLVDAEQTQRLCSELAWVARELGAVRDLEVLLDRLIRASAELSDQSDAALAASLIQSELQQRLDTALKNALLALNTSRYFELLDALVASSNQPPVTQEALKPAQQLLKSMAKRTWNKLDKDVRRLSFTSPDSQWHEVRIRAKRARYTADATATISGKAMRGYAQKLAVITDILGELHDAHVAELLLRELAEAPNMSGREGLALGRLLDLQIHNNLCERRRFTKAWPQTRSAARTAGLR